MSQRLDVYKMLCRRGWKPMRIGGPVCKGAAVWAATNDCGDSSLSRRAGRRTEFTIGFARDVPARVIVAACEASS